MKNYVLTESTYKKLMDMLNWFARNKNLSDTVRAKWPHSVGGSGGLRRCKISATPTDGTHCHANLLLGDGTEGTENITLYYLPAETSITVTQWAFSNDVDLESAKYAIIIAGQTMEKKWYIVQPTLIKECT